MKPIQFLLLPLLLFLLVIFFRKLRPYPRLRILVSLALLSAIVFTLFLDSSTFLANWLGVGRGVDLIFYLSILGLTVSCVLLYLRSMRLERMITDLVRAQALDQAENNEQTQRR